MTRWRVLREHGPRGMVYVRSMTLVLAVLLLIAMPADGQATEPAAGDPALEKPAVPRQQLKILDQDLRLEAYQQFRALYEEARYEEALPYARQVLDLSASGEDPDYELPIAYNNLGATQYQLGDYAGAAASYRESLDMLESTQGISSRRLVVPLAGLGAAYAALNEYQVAAELYDRALGVSRRADGLFNLQQIPLIKQAADSRYAIRDFTGAEREYMYALKIAEQNFGYGDPRTIPPLLELGTFYESLREYIAARMVYMRARDAALQVNPGYSPEAVQALTGIARSHRLQYTMDPDGLESQQPLRDEITGEVVPRVYRDSGLPPPTANRTGVKAGQQALDLLRATPAPPPELMTRTLLELGDWYQATSRPAMSLPYYGEAAAILDKQSAADPLMGHPLRAPRMVFYRPPLSASRGLDDPSGRYVIRKTVFVFEVTEAGKPQNITVVSTDMNEERLGLSRRAIEKAIYSPRFAEGKPVSTAGVTFTGEWYEEITGEDPPQAPADVTPAPPPAVEPASTPGT